MILNDTFVLVESIVGAVVTTLAPLSTITKFSKWISQLFLESGPLPVILRVVDNAA